MQFTTTALLAFAATATAQIAGFDVFQQPGKGATIPAGTTYDIEWAPAGVTGTVTIGLLGGADAGHLQVLSNVAASVDNSLGSYSWAVDATLGNLATYGLSITLDSNQTTFQYSFPFVISGGKASASGTTSSGSESTSTSAAVSPSSTPVTSTTLSSTTAAPVTTSAATNQTATTSPPKMTTVTTIVTPAVSTVPTKTGNPATVPTNGASSLAAGSLALLGGLAAVFFTL